MPNVFIVPGDSYNAAIKMFEKAGFNHTKDYQEVDLVCFLGGTDVDPAIYGEERGPYTQSPDVQRDKLEVGLYKKFLDTPKVGICRGGQLLNVLNGGKMIQHISHGYSGDVDVGDMVIRVDHHQGILPNSSAPDGCVWQALYPDEQIAFGCYYPKTESLCFQPHPEWGHKGTEDYFFELIEHYFGFVRKT